MASLDRFLSVLYLAVLSVFAIGCGQQDYIQTYDVPKDSAGEVAAATGTSSPDPPASTAPTTATTATDRMIAAILPEGERAWFFKAVGQVGQVDRHAAAIGEFLASIRPAGSKPLPSWQLPAGWTEQPGAGIRAATIVLPGDPPLELTVTTLGWRGTTDELVNNINRWRGQMQLPPIDAPQLAETTRELKVGDATITVVDLRGRFHASMTPPLAGAASSPPFAPRAGGSAPPGADTNLPPGHPPIGAVDRIDAGGRSAAAPSDVPTFDVPATWQAVAVAPGSMRKASFTIADGDLRAEVSVIDFSNREGALIADPVANVKRWRGEVGLPPITKDQLADTTTTIHVAGRPATYAAMIPDAAEPGQSQNQRATLAAIVPRGDVVWFIKLTGDRALVAAEQQHFEDFLKSVRFPADRGATDGNR